MPKSAIDYKKRAEFIRKFTTLPFNNRTKFSATQKRTITRTYKKYRKYSGIREKKANAATRKKLADRGFVTTKTGVLVDDFRDGFGNRIEGSKVRILSDGIIKITLDRKGAAARRDDYLYNFTGKEKIEFLQNPEQFVENLIRTIPILKRNFDPEILRSKPARQQIKFIINGSFSSHSNVTLDALEYYVDEQDDPAGFSQAITGLRFLKFTPKKRGVTKKHGKKKKVGRRTRRRN